MSIRKKSRPPEVHANMSVYFVQVENLFMDIHSRLAYFLVRKNQMSATKCNCRPLVGFQSGQYLVPPMID